MKSNTVKSGNCFSGFLHSGLVLLCIVSDVVEWCDSSLKISDCSCGALKIVLFGLILDFPKGKNPYSNSGKSFDVTIQ